jgi:membrane associated rhomboid family serine protease
VSLDVPTVFLIVTALSVALLAARLLRVHGRLARDWLFTLAIVVVVGAVTWASAPTIAGYAAFAALTLLVVVPLRLDRAAQRAARAGDDVRAQRFAKLARALHPVGVVGRRGRALAMFSRVAEGEPIDEAVLEALGAKGDPLLAELYRLSALHAGGRPREIREALTTPSRRHRMLQLGFGAAWLRAVGQTAGVVEILDAAREVERFDTTLVDPERRALVSLEIAVALGDVETTRTIATTLHGRVPRGFDAWAVASAARNAGDVTTARDTVAGLLADPTVSSRVRRMLASLETPRLDAPLNRTPEAEQLLSRLRQDVAATAALAPLSGDSAKRPTLTWGLSALLAATFVVLEATGDSTNEQHLKSWGALVVPMHGLGEAWRLFTATLLHAGILHLTMNLVALVVFGAFVEHFYGHGRMIAIWLFSTVISGLTVVVFRPPVVGETVLVGASGAIFGLAGSVVAALLIRPDLRKSRRGRDELRRLAMVFATQIVFDNLVPAVSGSAHLGGLFGGAALGALLVPRLPSDERKK